MSKLKNSSFILFSLVHRERNESLMQLSASTSFSFRCVAACFDVISFSFPAQTWLQIGCRHEYETAKSGRDAEGRSTFGKQ